MYVFAEGKTQLDGSFKFWKIWNLDDSVENSQK